MNFELALLDIFLDVDCEIRRGDFVLAPLGVVPDELEGCHRLELEGTRAQSLEVVERSDCERTSAAPSDQWTMSEPTFMLDDDGLAGRDHGEGGLAQALRVHD